MMTKRNTLIAYSFGILVVPQLDLNLKKKKICPVVRHFSENVIQGQFSWSLFDPEKMS